MLSRAARAGQRRDSLLRRLAKVKLNCFRDSESMISGTYIHERMPVDWY